MTETEVKKVAPGQVEIRAGNVLFTCTLSSDKKSIRYTKSKPDTQVYNRASAWVSPAQFKQVMRQAAEILRNRQPLPSRRAAARRANSLF
jgi:hypothetical protein